MLTPPNNPKRRSSREGTAPQPPHPTSPAANMGRQRGGTQKVTPALPPDLLDPPSYPVLPTPLPLTDPAAADFIMACAAATAPLSHIENQLALQPGSLGAHILGDRSLAQRYQIALVGSANAREAIAMKLLAIVASRSARAIEDRALLNAVGVLNRAAEADRRLSESLGRKVIGSPDKQDAKRRSDFKRVWGLIQGSQEAYAPAVTTEIVITSTDPLSAAKEILPQLRKDFDARRATGEPATSTMLLAAQSKQVERFIKRHEHPSSAAQPAQTPATAPLPITPAAKQAPPSHPIATDEYLSSHPDARHRLQHEHGGKVTVELLRDTLGWLRSLEETPLRKRQIASLEGRIRACDLDDDGAIGSDEYPSSAVAHTATAPTAERKPFPINLNLTRPPSAQTKPAKSPEARALLEQKRAQVATAKKEARGFPAGSAIVRDAEKLEVELATMEAEMDKS